MNEDKPLKIIINYDDFKSFSTERRQKLSEYKQAEFLIYIKEENYNRLSDEDKKILEGFERTETEPLRMNICKPKDLFLEAAQSFVSDIKVMENSFKEKHRKQSKPYVLKIIGKVWNKKRGGR